MNIQTRPQYYAFDSPIRVEDGSAWCFTSDRLIHDGRKILALLEWGIECGDGHDSPGSLCLCGWEHVPGKSDSISIFNVVNICVGEQLLFMLVSGTAIGNRIGFAATLTHDGRDRVVCGERGE